MIVVVPFREMLSGEKVADTVPLSLKTTPVIVAPVGFCDAPLLKQSTGAFGVPLGTSGHSPFGTVSVITMLEPVTYSEERTVRV